MFRRLRNRLLIVNMIIISALVIGSFSVIYILVAHNTNNSVNQRLNRELSFTYDDKNRFHGRNDPADMSGNISERPPSQSMPPDIPPQDDIPPLEGGIPPEDREGTADPGKLPGKKADFVPAFAVMLNSENEITDTRSQFELSDESYKENVASIIFSGKESGFTKYADGYWAYRNVPYRSGSVIAFVECKSERIMIRNLIIVLSLVGIAALTIAFLISLYSANRSIKPIEASYNKQKQFVADASHELKTPLTTINTNIAVLMEHKDNTIREEQKWLTYIKSEVERMTKLTNDLLYLARIDHDSKNILYENVSFSEAVESVILTMEASFFEHELELDYSITPDVYVAASPEQLKQLVMILLDNAVKYTPAKGKISVSLDRDQKSDAARLIVKNTGSGISEEDRKNIFERFYRADKSRARKSGGYGLGLAIAKAISEDLGGSIKCDSAVGEYTAFKIKLPISKRPNMKAAPHN